MMKQIRAFLSDESGISAIEYALMAAGVALAIATTIDSLGEAVKDKFSDIITELGGTLPTE